MSIDKDITQQLHAMKTDEIIPEMNIGHTIRVNVTSETYDGTIY